MTTNTLIAEIFQPETHSNPGEKWKPIDGHENYLISNQGRVWSVRRQMKHKTSKAWVGGDFVNLHKLKKGIQVNIPVPCHDVKRYLVRDLVKAAFPDLT